MPLVALDMDLQPWLAVNDGVMGGVSAGRMSETALGLSFEGVLSLENNGGFASVRRLVGTDLSTASSVRIRVRGDGRRYQLRLRQDSRFDGVAWRAFFDADDAWRTVSMDFDEFEPVFRGRRVPEAGPLQAENVSQIGFMLADGNPGPFRLEIESIEFCPAETA